MARRQLNLAANHDEDAGSYGKDRQDRAQTSQRRDKRNQAVCNQEDSQKQQAYIFSDFHR